MNLSGTAFLPPRFLRLSALAFLILLPALSPALRAANAVKVYIEGTLNGDYGEVVLGSGGAVDDQGVFMGETSLLPDKVYQLTLTGQFESATLNLVATGGYKVFISGSERKRIQIAGDPGEETSAIYDIELRKSGSGAPAGASSGLSVGDIHWGVSLGRTYNGTQAGSLVITSESLDSSLFNRGILSYYGINGQTGVYRDLLGRIRQVITPDAFVDIVDLPGIDVGFVIRFYPLSARNTAGGLPYSINPGAQPYIAYAIEPDTANGLKVTKTAGEHEEVVSAIETSPGHWGKTLAGEVVRENRAPIASDDPDIRIEDLTLSDGNDVAARKTRRYYKKYLWNKIPGYPQAEELIKVIQDPDGAALTTDYEYYTDATQRGSYGRLHWIKHPDGNWVKYDYYEEGSRRGQVFHEYRPWLNSPAAPESATTEDGHVITHDYADDWDSVGRLVSSRVETVNGITVASQGTANTFPEETVNGLKVWIRETATQTGGEHTLDSRTGVFRTGQDEDKAKYNDLPWFVENADGTKELYEHSYGAYSVSGNDHTFTADDAGDYLQTTIQYGLKAADGSAEGTPSCRASPPRPCASSGTAGSTGKSSMPIPRRAPL